MEAFDFLNCRKAEIENALGTSLLWSRGEETKSSKIHIRLNDVNIENEEDWPRMAKFHADWSKKFYDVITPYNMHHGAHGIQEVGGLKVLCFL